MNTLGNRAIIYSVWACVIGQLLWAMRLWTIFWWMWTSRSTLSLFIDICCCRTANSRKIWPMSSSTRFGIFCPRCRYGSHGNFLSNFDLLLGVFCGFAMPAQHTRSTGLLCGRPVALEFSTRQLERFRSWQGQLQTSAEDAFIYTVLKHLAY